MADDNPYVKYNGEWVTRDSALGKEAAKWEKPYKYEHFPLMMFRAQRIPGNGKLACSLSAPSRFGFARDEDWLMARQAAEAFTSECQRTVNDERERKQLVDSGEGWCDTPQEAIAWQENLVKIMGDEAAARVARDQGMSEAARAEADKFERENFGHQPVIPEKPKRKYVRKVKPEPSAA